MRRDRGRIFFFDAVDVGRNNLSVPVNVFRRVRLVEDIHRDGDALAQADQRTRNAAVVPDRADGVVLGDIHQDRTDAQRNVGRAGR